MSFRTAALAMMAVLIAASPAFSDAKPDFNGLWKMNAEKSGMDSGSADISVRIEHNEPKLKLTVTSSENGEQHTDIMELTTDGSEHKRTDGDGEITESAIWDGPVLVLKASGRNGQGDFTWKRRVSLSGDGNTLTADTEINGESKHAEVFEKQH